MKKFIKKPLNLILLISLIWKCSFGSNEIFEDTTDFTGENEQNTFEDTTIEDFETQNDLNTFEDTTIEDFETQNDQNTFEDTTIEDFETQNDQNTFEDTTIEDFETQGETDVLSKETFKESSTLSIEITTQKETINDTNSTTNEATTNLPTKSEVTTRNGLTGATDQKSSEETENTKEETEKTTDFTGKNDQNTFEYTNSTTNEATTNLSTKSEVTTRNGLTGATDQKSSEESVGTEELITKKKITSVTEQKTSLKADSTTKETTKNEITIATEPKISIESVSKAEETTNKILTRVSEHERTSEAKGTVQERSSPFSSSNENRDTSDSVVLTTSSWSLQSSLLISETSSLSTTFKVDEIPTSSFNTRIKMNGIVRNRRLQTVKRVLIQLDRILFIEDVNVTNIEQALLKSIGYESIFNVTNEGNDEYSIGFTTDINTSANSTLSLDDTVLRIVQNLKRDESLIQAEANKVGFDLNIDTSKAVISATETIVINGITYTITCEKSLDQVVMVCNQKTVENGTITNESSNEVDLESTTKVDLESTTETDLGSFANSSSISKFLLFFVTTIYSFQIFY